MTRNPGLLFSAFKYDIEVHPTKKSVIDEHIAIQRNWAQIFRRKPLITKEVVGFFLEEEYFITDHDLPAIIIWKVLFEEKIGWIQYHEPNINILPQK